MMADENDEREGYVMHGWSHVSYAWNAKLGLGFSLHDKDAKLELGFSLHNDIA